MSRTRLSRFIAAALALILLLTAAPAPLPFGGIERAEAAFLGPNGIVGLFRIGAALGARNRVYREAGATAAEINVYYDGLIAQAQTQRREAVARAQAGDIPARFVGSYTRIEAALEAERSAAIQMIEAEKNQARKDFNRNLGKEIVNILVASPGGQRVIGRVRDVIRNTREAVVAVKVAVEKGSPTEALRDALGRQVGDIPIVRDAARELGSIAGEALDRALGGALGKVERVVADVQAGVGEALGVLDGLDAEVAQLAGRARQPVSVVEDSGLIGRLAPVDRANAVLDVAASAHAGAAALSGKLPRGATRGDMRDRIRDALLGERLGEIQDLVSGRAAGSTYCLVSDRATYESAAQSLGQAPQTPFEPEKAIYLVCYDVATQQPVSVRMVGTTAEEPPETSAEPEVTETPAATAAPAGSEVAPCALLPVDESMVEMRGDYFCQASIDAWIGCDACGSDVTLTRLESEERARELAAEHKCANPNFYARGDSPIGDLGSTCTETSGETYRPEVAYVFYRLVFAYGRYKVRITAQQPGKEEQAIALGQEIIVRIDALR